MKIKVRTQSLGDIDVDIPQTSRVSTLRPIVAEHTGLDATTLRFIFHGRVLDDGELLTDRGVTDGTTVLMVTRRPPGAADESSSQSTGTSGSGNRRQSTTTNLVNAEINIMRTGFLSDREGAVGLIRNAVQRFATPLSSSLSWEVDSRENLPQQGDLTILVRLLGNQFNHPSSGARARILRITDILSRVILATQVIKDDLCQMVDNVVARNYTVNDESFARLDECILRLEETLLVPRSVSSHPTVSQESAETPLDASGPSEGRPSSAPETNEGRSSRNITRHSTRLQYSQLLDHVIATQADFSAQVASYQTILRNPQVFCLDEYTRCLAQVFQEHTRRMLHCFGHIFHCLSDISASFETPEQDQLRPLIPESESPYRTEAVFRIIALTGEESRIRTLGQQAAQAFRSATHQPSMQNVRMQIFGDVRMCRLPSNVNLDTRLPVFSAVVPRFGTNQSYVQFPTPVPSIAGPLDFNMLQRLFPPSHFAAAQAVPVNSTPSTSATASASAESSTLQREDAILANSSPTSGSSPQQTGLTNGTTSSNTRRISMLRLLFTEAFNHLLANRVRSSIGGGHGETGSTTSGPTQGIETPRLSRSGSGSLTFQGVNVHPHSAPGPQIPQHTIVPGMISQFVVETDGTEEARHWINVAMQAMARPAVPQPTQYSRPLSTAPQALSDRFSIVPRSSQFRPLRSNVYSGQLMPEVSRPNQVVRVASPGMPQAWLSGPVYATDRYLPCRSSFASTNAETNRTRDYQGALRTIREAALRYERSLPENSEQRGDAELVTDRWSALREGDERHTRRILGGNVAEIGTMQNDPAQFERVLGNILERIVHQMAVTDPDIAEDLGATRNDFESYFHDLTSETRNHSSEDVSHINMVSTSQEGGREDFSNIPSTSTLNGSTLQRVSSEPTLNTQDSSEMLNEGGDGRWIRELQVLHLIADILNAPGGATVGQFLRREGYQYSHAGGGFINLLITMCCEVLDTTDFMRLLSGDLSTFGSYRQQMRRYIIENVLDDNSRPSSEDLENVARRLQLGETVVNRLFDADLNLRRFVDAPDVGRVDITASALNIDRLFLQKLLSLLVNNSDGLSSTEFSRNLSELFSGYFRRLVAIANLSSNSPTGYSDVLMQLTRSGARREEEQSQVRGAVSLSPEARSDYQLMESLMESSLPRLEAYLRQEAAVNLSDITNELVLVDATAEELSWSTDSAETVIAAGNRSTEANFSLAPDEGSYGKLRTSEKPNSKSHLLSRKLPDDKHDLSCLPQSWIGVIEDDIRSQSTNTSQQLSEAYLSGDPFIQGTRRNNVNPAQGCSSTVGINYDESATNLKNESNDSEIRKKKKTVQDDNRKREEDFAAMEIDLNESVDERTKSSKAP